MKLETLTGHKFQEIVEDEQSMPRRVLLYENDLRSTVTAVAALDANRLKVAARGSRKRREATERLERARTRENEHFEEGLRREDKKRKLAEKVPKKADEGAPPTHRV